jgi:tetratricopeptide (TPR) repeat protein
LGDRWALASALNNLGELARCRGDYAAAKSCYYESLTLRRELDNRIGIAVSLHNLGHVAHQSGDDGQAGALFAEALLMSRELGDVQCIAENLTGLAGVFATQSQPDRALRLFGAAEALLESIGARLDPADRVERDRNIAIARRGSLDDKASQSWWSEGRRMTSLQAAGYALESLGDA